MADGDYASLTPRPARAKRTYNRKKQQLAPPQGPASSSSSSIIPSRQEEEDGRSDDLVGSAVRKRRLRDEPDRVEGEPSNKIFASKRARVVAAVPSIQLNPASPRQRQPSLPPMPQYGTIRSDGLPSSSSWISPRNQPPALSLSSNDDEAALAVGKAPAARRARKKGDQQDNEPASARPLGKGKQTDGRKNRLGSPFALVDKSNLGRGGPARALGNALAPASAKKSTQPKRASSSSKRVQVWRDSAPKADPVPLAPLESAPPPRFSFTDLRSALPESPPRSACAPAKVWGSPFGLGYDGQSSPALRGLSDASSIIGADGMDDNSSIVIETYGDGSSEESEDEGMQLADGHQSPTEVIEPGEDNEAGADLASTNSAMDEMDHSGFSPSPEELQTLDEEDIVSANSSSGDEQPPRYSPQHATSRQPSEPASAAPELDMSFAEPVGGFGSTVPDDVGQRVRDALANPTAPSRAAFDSSGHSAAPHSSPQSHSQPLTHLNLSNNDSSSSPFPPRRPKLPVLPARVTGPNETEDDLAYFIATTATGSSDVDSSSADERAFKASEAEIGYSIKAGSERVEARRQRKVREGQHKGEQFLPRGETLRVGEDVSEDEIAIQARATNGKAGLEE